MVTRARRLRRFSDLAAAIGFALAASQPASAEPRSARQFLAEFYHWYAPIANRKTVGPSWATALQVRGKAFSPHLQQLLAEDLAAQQSCSDLIGLDFDPIVNSQDAAEAYEVGKIAEAEGGFVAEIYGVQGGTRRPSPDLSVRLAYDHGHWQIVNIDYPENGTLVDILTKPKLRCESPR